MDAISVETTSRSQMIDVTAQVRAAVRKSGVKSGVVMLFVPHTTAGVTINENADRDVTSDILKELDRVIPEEDGYAHAEGNSAAHVKSSVVGCQMSVFVEKGELALGTWQGIYFCEFDGPRSRKLYVKVMESVGA
jgi:secondary thiamine-phosphate synthase enzyme